MAYPRTVLEGLQGLLGGGGVPQPGPQRPGQVQGLMSIAPQLLQQPEAGFFQRLNEGVANNATMLGMAGAGLLAHRQNATRPMFDPQMMAAGMQIDQARTEKKEKKADEKRRFHMTRNFALEQMGMDLETVDALDAAGELGSVVVDEMKRRRAPPDYPTSYEEHLLAQADPEYAKALEARRKGAGVTVNNIPGASESAFSKYGGEARAKRFDGYVTSADNAQTMIGQVQELRRLGPLIGTGKTAEAMAAIGPYAEALGVDIEGLGEAQAFKAITARLAPSMRIPGSGSSSDIDVRMFLESLPSLGNTPEGNALIEDTLEAIYERQSVVGDIASQALSGDLDPHEAERMIRDLPDPLEMWRESTGRSGSGDRRRGGARGSSSLGSGSGFGASAAGGGSFDLQATKSRYGLE